MPKTLAEIAAVIKGEVVGDKELIISNISGLQEAKSGDLTFVSNPKYFPLVKTTKASAIITPRGMEAPPGVSIICVDNPSIAFAQAAELLFPSHLKTMLKGIHPTAILGKDVHLGKDVAIGPHVMISDGVSLGERTIVCAGTYVGYETKVGNDCYIYPNVTLREKVFIGSRVIIHSGTVIGSDGFGYEFIDGKHQKIPQVGTVIVEDDVEIGSNVTIDRARFDKTFIGRGTKIDNLVQIAHNVIIGENCIIIAQVGISGSTIVEKNAILAGQAGLAGHLTIGAGAIVAAQAGVTKSVLPGTKVSGYPAQPHEEAKKVNAALQRLPIYAKTIQELKKKVKDLEDRIEGLTK